MNKSDSIVKLAAALAKALPKIEGATKDKSNPAFRSKYADLGSVSEAIAGPAAENGLTYVQVAHERENAAAIETIIVHESGEWLSAGIVAVPVTKHDAHGFGSALTYARRYSLAPAFGVVPEDDDGNAAAAAAPKPTNGKPPPKSIAIPTAEQERVIADFCAAIETAPDLDKLKEEWEKAHAAMADWDKPMAINLIDAAKNKRGRDLKAALDKKAA